MRAMFTEMAVPPKRLHTRYRTATGWSRQSILDVWPIDTNAAAQSDCPPALAWPAARPPMRDSACQLPRLTQTLAARLQPTAPTICRCVAVDAPPPTTAPTTSVITSMIPPKLNCARKFAAWENPA